MKKNHRNATRSNDKTQWKKMKKKTSDTPKTGSIFVEFGPMAHGPAVEAAKWATMMVKRNKIREEKQERKKKKHGQME